VDAVSEMHSTRNARVCVPWICSRETGLVKIMGSSLQELLWISSLVWKGRAQLVVFRKVLPGEHCVVGLQWVDFLPFLSLTFVQVPGRLFCPIFSSPTLLFSLVWNMCNAESDLPIWSFFPVLNLAIRCWSWADSEAWTQWRSRSVLFWLMMQRYHLNSGFILMTTGISIAHAISLVFIH